MKYKILISLVFTFYFAFAQPEKILKKIQPWQVKSFAKAAEQEGDLYSAIDYYEYHHKISPGNAKTIYKLGELYLKTRNYEKAEDYFLMSYEGSSKKYPLAHYFYAKSLMQQGKYKDAKEHFAKFVKEYKSGKEKKKYKKLSMAQINGCDLAKQLKDSSLKVVTTHLDESVNKAHIEANPIIIDDNTIWYTSLRADNVNYYDVNDTLNNLPLTKFYKAVKKGGKWCFVDTLNYFNDTILNVGNGAFSVDRGKFYFTKCKKNWKNKTICHIWVSYKEGGEWLEPEELPEPINIKNYTSTQPTLGVDAKKGRDVLYYVSDRPGGKGGLDIWYSIYDKRKNNFIKTKKMNSKINTIGNEFTPFYDNNTRNLYFSSDGLPGMGGYDIFKTTGDVRDWTEPVNYGYPINSQADDIYFTLNENRKEGFFVSNREGGVSLKNKTCCDDIYKFIYSEFIDIKFVGTLIANKDNSIFRTINEKMGIKTIDQGTDSINTTLSIIDLRTKKAININSKRTDKQGNCIYNLEPNNNYEIRVNNFGFFEKIMKVSTFNIKESTTLYDTVIINPIPQKPIPINIYYDFDKYNLSDMAKNTIDSTLLIVLEEIPNLKIELSSHTDSKGEDDYNKKLSQKRAESVVKYLIKKGIKRDRLIAKGYGEEKPIAPNENPDGTDNEEGRQKNRRTEFKFINIEEGYNDY